ncbi:leucine-rich repeat domain-containing protein [Ruminococcus sp.]|uniref:leucine-rich repeat domain-containing protein n=1 Tax=Ruminococcus sp. TaxID=41978 RepID=UPI0025CDB19F|nr:leucine-rich repeat domain-containing protein [Ruminococcus sp.]
MQCEKCNAPLDPKLTACPQCGAPVPQNIEGFENTMEFQHELRAIVVNDGPRAVTNRDRFIGLLNDHIPDYDKERRLLINMYRTGILKMMLEEKNHEIAVMKAKSYMLGDLFLSENASEFVVACFTYLLCWPYESPLKVLPESEDGDDKKEEETRKRPVDINEMVFMPRNALRYRLSGNIAIPDGYTKLEAFCFDKFGSLRTIKLPSTLLAIGEYCFSSCKRLRGLELPEGLRIIKQGAFSQCTNLVMVKIPDGVLEIEDSTFSFCTSLEVIEIPPSVSSIGAEAFSGCDKLRKLFLPESIKFIDANAFSYCPNLVIYCIENSYVHKYCLATGIRFVLVTSAEEYELD